MNPGHLSLVLQSPDSYVGEAIVLGPIGNNYGMVTDSPVTFPDKTNDPTVAQAFERVWRDMEVAFRKLDESRSHGL